MSEFLNSLPSDPEPLSIERDLTIRAVCSQMGENLKRWYPDDELFEGHFGHLRWYLDPSTTRH